MITVASLRKDAERALATAGIGDAQRCAGYLVAAALGVDRAALLMMADSTVEPESLARVHEFIARRVAREPLDRIVGYREFYSLNFGLNEATLSPRADTETLVDAALAYKPARVLDIGTGTGCVALALLANLPEATAVATDISARALQQARMNAAALGLESRVQFVETNFADGITGPFDVIVSNPPYIPAGVIPTLADEVKNHDPLLALDGGVDGLDAYRILLSTTAPLLTAEGRLLLEIGQGQADDLGQIAAGAGWQAAAPLADLAGITRVLTFFREK